MVFIGNTRPLARAAPGYLDCLASPFLVTVSLSPLSSRSKGVTFVADIPIVALHVALYVSHQIHL